MKEITYLIAIVCDFSNINMEKKTISLQICISSFLHNYGKQKCLRIVEKNSTAVSRSVSARPEFLGVIDDPLFENLGVIGKFRGSEVFSCIITFCLSMCQY